MHYVIQHIHIKIGLYENEWITYQVLLRENSGIHI